MGCEVIRDGEGKQLAIACFRGRRRKPRCVVCHKRPGVALCDHPLAPDDLRLAGQETCSAALCERCRVRGVGDTDYCPNHKDAAAQLSLFG